MITPGTETRVGEKNVCRIHQSSRIVNHCHFAATKLLCYVCVWSVCVRVRACVCVTQQLITDPNVLSFSGFYY